MTPADQQREDLRRRLAALMGRRVPASIVQGSANRVHEYLATREECARLCLAKSPGLSALESACSRLRSFDA